MRTLLLADENVTVQRVIALTFAREPVRIVTVSDGNQAMDRMLVERPDIVLAGTTLPQVSGYELARFVKSRAELRNVPVLLLSGAFENIDEAQLKSSGANGVIEKPVEPIAVVNRVKELLGIASDADSHAGPGGRLSTANDRRVVAQFPTTPRAVTTSRPMPPLEPLRQAPAPAARGQAARDDDYLTSLESAFDSLDEQLAGNARPGSPRHTAPPAGRAPNEFRSGSRPSAPPEAAGNPVYEVDDEWFEKGTSREASPLPASEVRPAPQAPQPVYEVDDEWFKEDDKVREAREVEQRQLAAEMGIHELTDVPGVAEVRRVNEARHVAEAPRVQHVQEVHQTPAHPVTVHVQQIATVIPASASTQPHAGDPVALPASPAPPLASLAPQAPPATRDEFEPIPRTLPIDWFAMGSSRPRPQPEPPASEPVVEIAKPAVIDVPKVSPIPNATYGLEPAPPGRVADDFAALLAFEQGEKQSPPMIEPVIHAVTPEITAEMLEQIAATVADRLKGSIHVEPQAPHITSDMIQAIASQVSGYLKDSIRVEPAVPEISGDMIQTIASLVAGHLKDSIRVEPAVPEISGDMIQTIASLVSGHLKDSIRVEPAVPEISGEMVHTIANLVSSQLTDRIHVEPAAPVMTDVLIEQLSGMVADRLRDTVRVEAKAPEISGEMIDRISGTVAERLRETLHVEAREPHIDDAMLERVANTVAARLKDSIRVEPAIPELNGSMLDQIASTVAERLNGAVRESVRVETVAPELTGDMLEHVAHRVSERLQGSMPAPPPPAQITDEMLDRVAARVTERMQGTFSMDALRDSITDAIRDTVRSVVADTSERLVREEIQRIKSKNL